MAERPRGFRRLVAAVVLVVVGVLAAGAYVWRDDILRTQLDIRHRPCNFAELLPRLRER